MRHQQEQSTFTVSTAAVGDEKYLLIGVTEQCVSERALKIVRIVRSVASNEIHEL